MWGMKPSSEVALRSVLAADNEINGEVAERAISALKDSRPETDKLIEVLRIGKVCRMLCLSRTAIQRYLNAGLLNRVTGAGRWTLGVSKESYIRFTEQRRIRVEKERLTQHPPPPRPSGWAIRRQKREMLKRKIAWELRKSKDAPRLQRYLAIESYIATHPEHSYYLVCEAVGIPDRSYATFTRTSKRGETKYAIRRREILRLIQEMHPDKSVPVNVRKLTRRMNALRHNFSNSTVGRVLKLHGYKVGGTV